MFAITIGEPWFFAREFSHLFFCTTMNQLVGAAVSPILYILHYGCSLVARSFENITSLLANTSLPNCFFVVFPLVPRYTYSFPGICSDALKIIKTSWVMVVVYHAVCGSNFSPQLFQLKIAQANKILRINVRTAWPSEHAWCKWQWIAFKYTFLCYFKLIKREYLRT